MADPATSRVIALDASTETVVGSVQVPGAFAIDDAPDHSTLYVGTQIGDIYQIDPVALTVKHRYLASQIGPGGYEAGTALVMADGSLALLPRAGGMAGVDGYEDFAIWNPASNLISFYERGDCGGTPPGPCTVLPTGEFGAFARTPDRSKIIVASIDSDGTVCEVDEATGTHNCAVGGGYIHDLAISPDGNLIVIPPTIFSAQTLAQVAQLNFTGACSSATQFGGYVVSTDSKTLYIVSDNIVCAYDLATGNQVGWLPNIFVPPDFVGESIDPVPVNWPNLHVIDNTGLLAGPMEEGVGFLDTTALHTGIVGTQFANGYLNPATGPTGGGTATSWNWENVATATPVLAGVYFGGQMATSASISALTISATTPPGAAGPADVYALTSDGGAQLLPEAFSYGPTVLEVIPNAAAVMAGSSSSSSAVGLVYGYGLGPAGSTVPSGLQITVGGQAAQITGFNSNPFNLAEPPFPLQVVSYIIPPEATGSADVTLTTSSGSATVHGGMTYLPVIQPYPLSGAALAQGIYDPYTGLYYFTDANELRVFSRADDVWQPPISIAGAERLWGIALSPDGSKLVVTDVNGDAVYLLNPGSPSTVQKFPLPGYDGQPTGVAVTDAGIVYFAMATPCTGCSVVFKLDTSTGQVTPYSVSAYTEGDTYMRAEFSPLNSRVYFSEEGSVLSINTATDEVSYARVASGACCGNDDLALSGDQTRFAASGYFYDGALNAESYVAANDREVLYISYLYGEKLSPNGRLLFQPTSLGIDVLDGRLGNLLERIALPIVLSPNYDALVSDGQDNILVAITGMNGDGIAVIDLSSVPEPAPLTYDVALARGATHDMSGGTVNAIHPGNPIRSGRAVRPSLEGGLRIPYITTSMAHRAGKPRSIRSRK